MPSLPAKAPARARLAPLGLFIATLCVACDHGDPGAVLAAYPEASVYELDPKFAGEWFGEVSGVAGEMTIGELEPGKFFGSFRAEDRSVEYVLLLEQTLVDQPGGGRAASNRALFTWQDGRGGRGSGWLLINREDTAITGKFGYDRAVDGLGDWSLIRFDAG